MIDCGGGVMGLFRVKFSDGSVDLVEAEKPAEVFRKIQNGRIVKSIIRIR